MVRTVERVLDHLAHRLCGAARAVGHDLVRDAKRRPAVQIVRLQPRQAPRLARVVAAAEIERHLAPHPVPVRALEQPVPRADLAGPQDQLRELRRRRGGRARSRREHHGAEEQCKRTTHPRHSTPIYCPCFTPGSPHSSWIAFVGVPPGMFAEPSFLNSGRTTLPAAAFSIIALAMYHAKHAETMNSHPAVCFRPMLPSR